MRNATAKAVTDTDSEFSDDRPLANVDTQSHATSGAKTIPMLAAPRRTKHAAAPVAAARHNNRASLALANAAMSATADASARQVPRYTVHAGLVLCELGAAAPDTKSQSQNPATTAAVR
jgi:hypothetical protein